jgi:hypothetical protein
MRNQRHGSTISDRAVLEAERLMLVEQMCAAAASVGGLTPLSNPPPPKRKNKREVPRPAPSPARGDNRFASAPSELVFGRPAEAALGIFQYLHSDEAVVGAAIAAGGVHAIVSEVTRHGTEGDKEYVLHAEAGSSELTFQGGLKRDCGPDGALLECRMLKDNLEAPLPAGVQMGEKANALNPLRGMRIDDFVRAPQVRHARLNKAHVVALRLYSTAVRAFDASALCLFTFRCAHVMALTLYTTTG